MSCSEETFARLFDGGVRRLTPHTHPAVFRFSVPQPEGLETSLLIDQDDTAMLVFVNPTGGPLPVHLLLDYPQAGIDPFGRWAGYLLTAGPGGEAAAVGPTDITSRFVAQLPGESVRAYLLTPQPAKWIPRLAGFRRAER